MPDKSAQPEPTESPAVPPAYSFHVEPAPWVWDAFYNQPGYPPGQQQTTP